MYMLRDTDYVKLYRDSRNNYRHLVPDPPDENKLNEAVIVSHDEDIVMSDEVREPLSEANVPVQPPYDAIDNISDDQQV
jgi:hypothetical protein